MMTSYTYFAWSETARLMKIGRSQNPIKRMRQLPGNPKLVAVVAESIFNEAEAHRHFSDCRKTGEWFKVSKSEVLEFLSLRGFECIGIDQISATMPKRTSILIEISDDAGEALIALAKSQMRSVTAMARWILIDAIRRGPVKLESQKKGVAV